MDCWLEVSWHLTGPAFGQICFFPVIFPGPRSDAELTLKFHVALYASEVALPVPTSKFRPNNHTQHEHQNSLTFLSLFCPDTVTAAALML
jgi:hypothetical protein